MRYYYAEINESNVCIAVVDTHEPLTLERMIPISAPDDSHLFKVYADGVFSDPPVVPE